MKKTKEKKEKYDFYKLAAKYGFNEVKEHHLSNCMLDYVKVVKESKINEM